MRKKLLSLALAAIMAIPAFSYSGINVMAEEIENTDNIEITENIEISDNSEEIDVTEGSIEVFDDEISEDIETAEANYYGNGTATSPAICYSLSGFKEAMENPNIEYIQVTVSGTWDVTITSGESCYILVRGGTKRIDFVGHPTFNVSSSEANSSLIKAVATKMYITGSGFDVREKIVSGFSTIELDLAKLEITGGKYKTTVESYNPNGLESLARKAYFIKESSGDIQGITVTDAEINHDGAVFRYEQSNGQPVQVKNIKIASSVISYGTDGRLALGDQENGVTYYGFESGMIKDGCYNDYVAFGSIYNDGTYRGLIRAYNTTTTNGINHKNDKYDICFFDGCSIKFANDQILGTKNIYYIASGTEMECGVDLKIPWWYEAAGFKVQGQYTIDTGNDVIVDTFSKDYSFQGVKKFTKASYQASLNIDYNVYDRNNSLLENRKSIKYFRIVEAKVATRDKSITVEKGGIKTIDITCDSSGALLPGWLELSFDSRAVAAKIDNGKLSIGGKLIGKTKVIVRYPDTVISSDGIAFTIDVNITEPVIAVTGIKIQGDKTQIGVSEKVTLTAAVEPSNASNKNVTWSSGNPLVATVTNGVVTGLMPGHSTITCITQDGSYKATYDIQVLDFGKAEIDSISLIKDDSRKGLELSAKAYSSKGLDLEYAWYAERDGDNSLVQISDWSKDNKINWKPEKYGIYVVYVKARVAGASATEVDSKAGDISYRYEYHPEIKGICQMPYAMIAPGQPGYLIGIETYSDTKAEKVEMLILDCRYMQWVYSSGRAGVAASNDYCAWTVWQPEYGYYWTLFRAYDKDGNIIDECCYGFENIC